MQGLTKEDVNKALAGDLPPDVRRVLELRQQLGKTSNSKYETIAACASTDHRVRGTLQFYGASRTGRWAGRLIQVQNLPRTYLDHQDQWRELVKQGDAESIELLTGNVSDTLSQLIRTALVPGGPRTFVDADFSAIEARLIAWLAGEEWVLDVFRTTGRIYEATAARIFGVPFESIVKGNPNYKYRQRGKVATLALGYQGGVGAMKRMAATNWGWMTPGCRTSWTAGGARTRRSASSGGRCRTPRFTPSAPARPPCRGRASSSAKRWTLRAPSPS